MALYRCGSGSAMQKTTLYTYTGNLSSDSFAAQDITLSESINNFDYIGIEYAFPSTDTPITVIMSVEDFKKTSDNANKPSLALGWRTSSSTRGARRFSYVGPTTIHADGAYAGTSETNTSAIPQHIYGIKF